MALPTESEVTPTPVTPLRLEADTTEQPVITPQPELVVTSETAPPPAPTAPPTPEIDPYDPREYSPTPSSLPRIQQGLVSMLDKDSELMKLERARGMRIANQRGLGASSFAARAGEGAVMDYITPIVTQAEQFDVQKDLQAQTLSGRSYSEAQANIANRYQQDADIEFQRWAKEADLSHLQLLEGNRSAATAGQNYSNQLAGIYADPATTTLQKQEAVRLLSNAFTQNLELIEATSKIDLSKFLPDFIASQRPDAPLQAELDTTIRDAGWAVGAEGTGDFDAGGYGVTDTTGAGRSLSDLGATVGSALEKYSGTFTAGSLLGGPAVGAVAAAARAAYDALTGGSDDTSNSGTAGSGYSIGEFGGLGGGGGDRGASRSGLGSPGASRVGGVDRSGYA